MKNEREDSTILDVIIIGGGLSGLVCGFECQKRKWRFRIIEDSSRVGGALQSVSKNGFILEKGPNTVQLKPGLSTLIEELNLTSEMLLSDPKAPRYIFRRGKLNPIPNGLSSFITSPVLSLKGKLSLILEPFKSRRPVNISEETLESFGKRRLGKDAFNYLLSPFVSGIWAGDSTQLSFDASFPQLKKWEAEYGSLFKGMMKFAKKKKGEKKLPKGLMSFKSGIERLTIKLSENLSGAIRTNSHIKKVSPIETAAGIGWKVETETETIQARKIIFSSPAHQIAPLIQPWDQNLSKVFNEIPYAPIAILHIAATKTEVIKSYPGFGFLIPPLEKMPILGCIFNSNLFDGRAPQDKMLFTVFMGGATNPEVLKNSDLELFNKALFVLEPLMGFRKSPELISITRYAQAIPQYTMGHIQRLKIIQEAETRYQGLKFAGNFRNGISVGDVVENAIQAVNDL